MYRKKVDKRNCIMWRLDASFYNHGATHFSAKDIARITGYAYSTKFIRFIQDMVDDGLLCVTTHRYNGGVVGTMSLYCLPEFHTPQLELDL